MKKPVYSIYPSNWGNVQIRKNNDTEINIAAVVVVQGNGQYSTDQKRSAALKLARKIIKALN